MKIYRRCFSSILVIIFMTMLINLGNVNIAMGAEMSEENRLSVFLSNFTEASVPDIKEGALTDGVLISFGIMHNYLNNRSKYKYDSTTFSYYIPFKDIENSCLKYFGQKPKSLKSIESKQDKKGYYTYTELGAGEAYSCAKVYKVQKLTSDTYLVYAKEYNASNSFFRASDIVKPLSVLKNEFPGFEECGHVKAKVKKLKDRYILLSYDN